MIPSAQEDKAPETDSVCLKRLLHSFPIICTEQTLSFLWTVGLLRCSYLKCLKRRLSSGKVKKQLWVLSSYYNASVEEHQIQKCSLKAWLFKCLYILNILNMACDIIKVRTDCYATCLWSPIHLSVYSACNFTKTGPIFNHFDVSRTLQYTPILKCSMINLSDRFHKVSIVWPEPNFIFKSSNLLVWALLNYAHACLPYLSVHWQDTNKFNFILFHRCSISDPNRIFMT